MKKILPILFSLFTAPLLFGQTCTPDPAYADSTGVFPMPYDAELSPEGGISECAYIGQPYSFPFTVAVGDSITVEFAGFPLVLPLDSVVVNDVLGLPPGINYACAPTGCSFPKNSLGCAVIYGTPLASDTVGAYSLTIKGTAYFPSFPFEFDIDFPGEFAPGEYTLHLLQNSGDACPVTSVRESLAGQVRMRPQPNPTAGPAIIAVDTKMDGTFTLRVANQLGQVVHQEQVRLFTGSNQIHFDGNQLPVGLYTLLLQNERGSLAEKVVIQR